MFAVRFQDVNPAVLVAVGRRVLAEILQRLDVTRLILRGPADHEPMVTFQVNGTFIGIAFLDHRALRNTLQYWFPVV